MKSNAKKPGKLGIVLICLLLVAALAVHIACDMFRSTLDQFLGSRAELSDELLERGNQLAQQIQEEGTVLLKNEDHVLPLSKDNTKINVFGWSSTQWINGGSGSGQCATLETDFLGALQEAGIAYNQDLTNVYTTFLDHRPFAEKGALSTYPEEFSRLYEPSIQDQRCYTQQVLENAKAYSDIAVVVLGRQTGESNDTPAVQYKQVEKDGAVVRDDTRTYLEISTEEEALLTHVGQNYGTVIVLVNNTNPMNLSFLDRIPGLDACLLAGGTGANGTKALVKILYGEGNPSGRLTDTYAYDFSTAASYANSGAAGLGYYTNAEGLYPFDGKTTNGNVGDNPLYLGVAYVDYVEGIYVGYKWYETADAEGYWDQVSNEYGDGYEGVVQYPFGYGLSYTQFDWELVAHTTDGLEQDGKVQATVKVTNTGNVAGKDVVQLYCNPPYYTGEIEKSACNLIDFAKTDLLQPGESQEVTLEASVESLASYDCYDANQNGFVGWELDAGAYTFQVSRNAHEPVETFACDLAENAQYSVDSDSGNQVQNLFTGADAVDGVSLDGSDSDANITYLTRADFAGTFPAQKAADRAMSDNVRARNLYTSEMAEGWIEEGDAPIVTGADNGLSVTNRDGSLSKLGYALGADYHDPQWEKVLDQLTISEMEDLVRLAYVQTAPLPSIGKPKTVDLDGPAQIGSFAFWWFGATGTGFSNPTVLAQTYNRELSYAFGQTNGAQGRQLGVDGWYAPGVNLHRSVVGGRNFEYYSEDPFLSGTMCAQTVRGALDAGVYVYAKHFVAYEQESARDGVYVWMTEQTLRELYLRPFQMAIKEGGCTGIMSAYGRLGALWAGGSQALLTSLLREEWGFEGCVLTDFADHQIYMNGDQMLRAGGDIWMSGVNGGSLTCERASNSYQQALRRAAKDATYMYLNARVEGQKQLQEGGDPTCLVEEHPSLPVWKTALIGFDVGVGLLLCVLILYRVKKQQKFARAQQEQQ